MSEKQNQYKKYILPTSLSVVFLLVGFGLGVLYQKNHLQSSFTTRGSGQLQMNGSAPSTGGRNNPSGQGTGTGVGLKDGSGNDSIFGEVTKIDDSSITVKTTDGSSKIILLSDSTVFSQSTTAAKSDITVGTQIKVDGTTDDNTGSVTGKTIEINPSMSNQAQ